MKFIFLLLSIYVPYCCHAWDDAPTCYLELLNIRKNRVRKAVGRPAYVFSIGITLVRCSSEPAQLVPLPFSQGRLTGYSARLRGSSVISPRCYKDVYVNSFFFCTARSWIYLPIECFPLTYDLNGFKSRIYRHVLTVGYF